VPSLSILDGWWIEGHVEGVTGWAIGSQDPPQANGSPRDARTLHDKLEQVILPQFYQDRDCFLDVMRQAIALNGSCFKTHRMLHEYVVKAYPDSRESNLCKAA
jgi:starch phosphorylase